MKVERASAAVRARRAPAWRRRAPAGVTAFVLVAAGASVTAYLVEPRYRAAAALVIKDRSVPDLRLNDADRYAEEHLRERHARVLASAAADQAAVVGLRTQARVSAATLERQAAAGGTISITFDVTTEASDPGRAERAAAALLELYRRDDASAAGHSASPPERLLAARASVARAAAALADLRAELETFALANAGLLDNGGEAVAAEAERHLEALERRIAELEAHRVELDRGLGEMARAARADAEGPLSSESLVALQTQWAIARGRNGSGDAATAELGARVREMQAEANARSKAAGAELGTAQAELSRLERLHPIDHPDVVRQAHRVSALEVRTEDLRIRGLTTSELAYVEGVARERREVDGEVEGLRAEAAEFRARLAEQRAHAAQAPAIAEQHRALAQRVAAAETRYATEAERRNALEQEFAALLAQRPGELRVASPPTVRRIVLTSPRTLAALGTIAALLAALLTMELLERFDRRIRGARDIARLQGAAPLAEIPFIDSASQAAAT